MAEKFLNDIKRTKKSEPIVLGKSVALKSTQLKSEKKLIVEPRKNFQQDNFASPPLASRFHSLFWIGAFGLLIVFLINVLNSFGRGAVLISDVARSSIGVYQNIIQAGEKVSNSDFASAKNLMMEAQKNADEISQKLWFLNKTLNPQKISEYVIKAGNELINIIEIINRIGGVFMEKNANPANTISLRDEMRKLETSYKNFSENIDLA
ncbi:hypothetical protein HZA39_01470, partial [Candidatus Peregrinibacteria bacterium]|nr:hypothetical protein [Candidatus Peregrinibacteria bacterium]